MGGLLSSKFNHGEDNMDKAIDESDDCSGSSKSEPAPAKKAKPKAEESGFCCGGCGSEDTGAEKSD